MTTQGGDYSEESRDDAASFPHPDRPSYGYPPPPHGGPTGYGGGPPGYGRPPGYPPPYDPYLAYQAYPPNPHQTNGLAIASLITSLAGIVIGILLGCLGVLIPLVGVVLGAVALNQIKRTHQQGRGLAIAGIAVGSVTAALLLLIMIGLTTWAVHSPTVIGS
jgi:hypothetical protein